MVNNMMARGYETEFAKNCFNQIKGFGDYGFPESHAASFAQLVYVSSWLKHFHPGRVSLRSFEFAADGLLRAGADRRAMPARTASRCARSTSRSAIRRQHAGGAVGEYHALRLGFRQIDGFQVGR